MTKIQLVLLQALPLLFASLPSLSLAKISRYRANSNSQSRSITVQNEAGVKIDVFWVNPDTAKAIPDSAVGTGGLMYGASSGINSYVSHKFEVRELPRGNKGCKRGACRKAYFAVTKDEDQLFIVRPDFTVESENHRTKAAKMAKEALQECQRNPALPPMEQLEQYAKCLEQQINETLAVKQQEIEFQKQVRKDMGSRMMTYACQDPYLNTTTESRNSSWTYKDPSISSKKPQSKRYKTRVLFESDSNFIVLVENFFSKQDCQVLVDASPKPSPKPSTAAAAEAAAVAADGTSTTDIVEVRNVPLSAKPKAGPLMAKIYQLVLSHIQAKDVQYDLDPMLSIKVQTGLTKEKQATKTTQPKEHQCTVTDSGESVCTAPSDASSSSSSSSSRMLQPIEPHVFAQLRIFCSSSNDLLGGSVYYPKAGVHLNPVELIGHAIVTLFENPTSLKREVDPFVEDYVECPVQQGELVTIVQKFSHRQPKA